MKLLARERLDEAHIRWDLTIKGMHCFVAEGVVVHNTNSRVGNVLVDGQPELVCGSHNHRRKLGTDSTYELPLKIEGVKALLESFSPRWEDGDGRGEVVIYGEIYGAGTQKGFNYGEDEPTFRAFDIVVDGRYLDWDEFAGLCEMYDIEVAPILYEGPWDTEVVRQLVDGKSTLTDGHIREGVVIRLQEERFNQATGRTIIKWKSDDYLTHKHGV